MGENSSILDLIVYGVVILFQIVISYFVIRSFKDHDCITRIEQAIKGLDREIVDIKKRLDKWES